MKNTEQTKKAMYTPLAGTVEAELDFWAARRISSFSLHAANTALLGSSSFGSNTKCRPNKSK